MSSIFTDRSVFTTYHAEIKMRDKLLGGTPKSPDVIEGWLRKAGVSQEEDLRQMLLRTLEELGAEVGPQMSYDDLVEASKKLAAIKQTNGFKRNSVGIYIEDRQVKAMLKEAVNILYAGKERWGVTKKGPRNFTAERLFISPSQINLGKAEPDGVELMMVHADTPMGPRSSLAYHEYVEQARFGFDVQVLNDEIEPEKWPNIWILCEENGLGACRSQSFGRFDVVAWDKV